MRFQVRRTSQFLADELPPCEEAVKGTVPYWDHRTSKSPEEFDRQVGERTGDLWFSRGTEHGIVYGPRGGVHGIKRRLHDEDAWFVEFDSLEALIAFFEKHGNLVITTSWSDKTSPMVEIYDDYRE
jgi:hypothetical protein